MAKGTQLKDFLWYVVIAIIAFPVVPLFHYLGKPEFERPVGFAVILMLLVIKIRWDVRNRLWFWITMIAIAAVHVPIIMLTAQRLFDGWFPLMLLLGILDGSAILAVIRLVQHFIGSNVESITAAKSTRC